MTLLNEKWSVALAVIVPLLQMLELSPWLRRLIDTPFHTYTRMHTHTHTHTLPEVEVATADLHLDGHPSKY